MATSETCGAVHEKDPGLVCDRESHQGIGFHRNKAAGEVWEAAPLPDRSPRGRQALTAVAARTERPVRMGPAVEALRRR